jgi:hypothetical protein
MPLQSGHDLPDLPGIGDNPGDNAAMDGRRTSGGGRKVPRAVALLLALALAAAGCSSSSDNDKRPSDARDAGWRADIDALVAARERIHPDPYQGISKLAYATAVQRARAAVPSQTDPQVLTSLLRLAAMPSWAGRDGHSGIFPFTADSRTHEYPLRFWQFPDGLVVTAARPPYERLVGQHVVAIQGRPIDDVLDLVRPLVPRDNDSNLLAYAPLYLRVSEVLVGLGILPRTGTASFTVEDSRGHRSEVSVSPLPAAVDTRWNGGLPHRLPTGDAMWLSRLDEPLWWRELAHGVLFVQYNSVESGIDGVADDILARVRRGGISRVVVDLRNNPGGDNQTYGRLLDVLRDRRIDVEGRLFVLVGRVTFSAAANFATELEQKTSAVFVGEDMGGSPNLYGDAEPVPLPYRDLTAYVASRYWQISGARDRRTTIQPDIRVPLSSRSYAAGRDPVLRAALTAAR